MADGDFTTLATFAARHQRTAEAQLAQRAAAAERFVVGLSAVIVVAMVGYMFVGDRPFNPDLLAASEISPINRWAWIALFALSLPVLWMRRVDLGRLARALWPILALYAWFVLTTTWALDPAASTRRALLTCLTLIVVIAATLGTRKAERLHFLLCLPCIGVVTIDLLSWGVVPHIAMSALGLQGMHAQKNMLGMFSMYTIAACLTCLWGLTGKWQRRILMGGAGVAFITLFASRSGTSAGLTMAALGIVPALVVMLRQRPMIIAAWLTGLLLVLAGGLTAYFALTGLNGADPMAPLAGVTFTKRTDLWAFLIENIHKRPWGGSGFGSFWAIDKAVQPSLHSGLWFGSGKNIAPEGHNAYLDLAATTGLVGFGLGVFVLIRAIIRAGAAVHAAPNLMPIKTAAFHLGFCLMVMGHSFTESTLYSANSQLGTLFILAAVSLEWGRVQAAPRAQWRRPRSVVRPSRTRPPVPRAQLRR